MNKLIEIPVSLKVIKDSNKNYYSCHLNKKNHICSFVNEECSVQFVDFLICYKKQYRRWPQLTDEDDYISKKSKRNQMNLDDLLVEEHDTAVLMAECLLGGIGLMGFTDFEYNLKKDKIHMAFSAADFLPSSDDDSLQVNKQLIIKNLNKLL